MRRITNWSQITSPSILISASCTKVYYLSVNFKIFCYILCVIIICFENFKKNFYGRDLALHEDSIAEIEASFEAKKIVLHRKYENVREELELMFPGEGYVDEITWISSKCCCFINDLSFCHSIILTKLQFILNRNLFINANIFYHIFK